VHLEEGIDAYQICLLLLVCFVSSGILGLVLESAEVHRTASPLQVSWRLVRPSQLPLCIWWVQYSFICNLEPLTESEITQTENGKHIVVVVMSWYHETLNMSIIQTRFSNARLPYLSTLDAVGATGDEDTILRVLASTFAIMRAPDAASTLTGRVTLDTSSVPVESPLVGAALSFWAGSAGVRLARSVGGTVGLYRVSVL
jgi:hypothetical protein